MPAKLIEKTPSAYAYPLLIKQLLHAPLAHSPNQEIVYRDLVRYTYRESGARADRPFEVEGDHRRRASAQGAMQGGSGQRHRHLRRLRPE